MSTSSPLAVSRVGVAATCSAGPSEVIVDGDTCAATSRSPYADASYGAADRCYNPRSASHRRLSRRTLPLTMAITIRASRSTTPVAKIAGREDRGMVTVRLEERRLVDTEHPHRADAIGIIHERGAVLGDRVRDRPPTHPELTGDLTDRRASSPTWRLTSNRRAPHCSRTMRPSRSSRS